MKRVEFFFGLGYACEGIEEITEEKIYDDWATEEEIGNDFKEWKDKLVDDLFISWWDYRKD